MISMDSTVDDLLTAHPRLASLFVRHHMVCVGCDIARFHTVREAAVMYKIDPEQLRQELEQACVATVGPSPGVDAPPPA